jgi:hypothetical protein
MNRKLPAITAFAHRLTTIPADDNPIELGAAGDRLRRRDATRLLHRVDASRARSPLADATEKD